MENFSASYSLTTTTPQNSEFCLHLPRAVFETVDSSVPYILNASLNVPLAVTTTLANVMVLLAMRHITSIRLPSKLLLCSLVVTDLGAGLFVQPQFAILLFMKGIDVYSMHCSLVKSFYTTGSLFSSASLFTMTAICLDRYVALFSPLKYQQIVTVRRVYAALTLIWLFLVCLALISLSNNVFWGVLVTTGIVICFLVNSVATIKIYRRLRSHHDAQIQPGGAGNTLNMAQYKRTASAMMWIYVLFFLCYLPYLSLRLVVVFTGMNALAECVYEFFYTVILLNSCLNPFVYCLRLPEIRTGVLKHVHKICCRIPQQRDADPEGM